MNANQIPVNRDSPFAKPLVVSADAASIFQRAHSAASTPATRSTPPIRASGASKGTSQGSYRALGNAVLKRRFLRLLVLSGVGIWVMLYFGVLQGSGKWVVTGLAYRWLSPNCWVTLSFATGIIWLGGVLPIILLKKLESTRQKDYSPTRYAHFSAVFLSGHFLQVLLASSISGAAVWAGFVLSAMQLQEGATLGPFVTIKGREALQYNERPFYMLYAQLALAFWFACVYAAKERGVLPLLASPKTNTIAQRIVRRLESSLRPSLHLLVVSSILTFATYITLRYLLLPTLVLSHWGAVLFRPRLVAVLRRNAAFALGVQWRSFMVGGVYLGVWEITGALWEVYMTQPWKVSEFAGEPNKCLVEGLRDERTQHMALLELSQIASSSNSKGRKAIFSDIRGSPRAFNAIARECLKVVGETYRTAQSRGGSRLAITPPVLSQTATPLSQHPSNSTGPHSALRANTDVFRPAPKKTVLSRLVAADTPLATPKAVNAASSAIYYASSTLVNRVPDIFQSPSAKGRSSAPTSTSAPTPTITNGPGAKAKVGGAVAGMVPGSVKDGKVWKWLFEPRWNASVDKCVPRWQRCALAVDALSKLLSASLTEDSYGVAQNDIPKVLEGFVICLEGLELLEEALQKEAKTKDDEELIREAVWESLRPLQTALGSGLALVLATFAGCVHEMRFPPRVAQRLQSFVDFA